MTGLSGPYFLEISADIDGGVNYENIGSQELMSVPYALYAKTAGNGPQGEQGIPGNRGSELKGSRVNRALKVFKEIPVPRVLMEHKESKASRVLKVSKVNRDQQDHKEYRGKKDLKVFRVIKVLRVFKVIQDQPVQQEPKEYKGNKVLRVFKVIRDPQVTMERKEFKAHRVCKAFKGTQDRMAYCRTEHQLEIQLFGMVQQWVVDNNNLFNTGGNIGIGTLLLELNLKCQKEILQLTAPFKYKVKDAIDGENFLMYEPTVDGLRLNGYDAVFITTN